ncbi:aspartate kinase [Deltaproteobacteria bacterium TL4]
MTLIVKKFGGTSLGTAERLLNVANIIQNTMKQHDVIAVVSALSSETKAEGTTSRLIKAGELILSDGDFNHPIDLIRETHFEVVETAIKNHGLREEIREFVYNELLSLKSFLEALHVIGEISTRSHDVIVGTGERLSARLVSGVLRDRGISAEYVDLSKIIPDESRVTDPQFYANLQTYIADTLLKTISHLPVVTGYFGFVQGGIINSIGRGYTDLTAALIAAKLQAEELQIWKEVDGIYTADPRKVPNARVLEYISPVEAAELTYFGSEVMHPFTMEQTINASVPIRIKNTFAPEKPGTVILPESSSHKGVSSHKKTAVAVTTKSEIHVLNIHSNRMLHSSGFLAQVFNTFQKHGIVIDLISTSEVNISCTVDKSDRLDKLIPDLETLGEVRHVPHRAILSLVGEGMKYVPGIAGKMFDTLAKNHINIEMITQGASEVNISCVIRQEDAKVAMQAIHSAFLENENVQ